MGCANNRVVTRGIIVSCAKRERVRERGIVSATRGVIMSATRQQSRHRVGMSGGRRVSGGGPEPGGAAHAGRIAMPVPQDRRRDHVAERVASGSAAAVRCRGESMFDSPPPRTMASGSSMLITTASPRARRSAWRSRARSRAGRRRRRGPADRLASCAPGPSQSRARDGPAT